MAPDGKTVIPDCYDLLRSSGLICAEPGAPVYTVDEYDHRTVRLPWRPTSLVFGGAAGDRLFIAAGSSLYEYIQ